MRDLVTHGRLFVAGALFLALAAPAARADTFHRIEVAVVDAEGEPLSGVRVTIRDARRPDLVQARNTSRDGVTEAFLRREGARIEIRPMLEGHHFEPPYERLVVDADLNLKFLARPGAAPATEEEALWPEAEEGAAGSRPRKGPAAEPRPRMGPGAGAAPAVIEGQVQWAYVYPDGSVNEIALEGARLVFDRVDLQQMRRREPSRVSDENGGFEPFEVELGARYEVTVTKAGFEFDPPVVTVDIDEPEVFLTFTGREVLANLRPVAGDDEAAETAEVEGERPIIVAVPAQPTIVVAPAEPPAAAVAVPAEPQVASILLGPAKIAVQVTAVAEAGSTREVGVDGARVLYRNVATDRRGWRVAEGGIAPPYHTTLGSVFEITAEKQGYRFPTERVQVTLEETFVPLVGERLANESCTISGSLTDYSENQLLRWLGVSVYDRDGGYLQGHDARPDRDGIYTIGPLEAGVYILRVTPAGRADPLYVAQPSELRVDCRGAMRDQDFTVR